MSMRLITANQRHIPTHQLTIITIQVTLAIPAPLDTVDPAEIHTEGIKILTLTSQLTTTLTLTNHRTTIRTPTNHRTTIRILTKVLIHHPLIHTLTVEIVPIRELQNWTIANQLLSTKSMSDRVIKPLPMRKLTQFNFPMEVF